MPELSVAFDHAQPRYVRDRIGVALGGKDLAANDYSSGVFVDPVTATLWLKPRCFSDAWYTGASGLDAKLRLTDFGSPSGFAEYDAWGNGAGYYLVGPANSTIQTTASYAVNTGFVVQLFSFSAGAEGVALECGWGAGTALDGDTAVRVYNSGQCEVWRGGVKVASGQLWGSSAGQQSQNDVVRVVMIPGRVRELLILSGEGSGIRAIMPDIDEASTSPAIVPAGKFWLRCPDITTQALVAPLKFETSGSSVSETYLMSEAPDPLDTRELYDNQSWAGGSGVAWRIYGNQSYRTGNTDAASITAVQADGSTAFSATGSARQIRIKIALSGDGNSSPAIYGGEIGFATKVADTDDSELYDATSSVTALDLNIPDGGEGASAAVELCLDSSILAGVAALKTQFNRPVAVSWGSVLALDGFSGAPTLTRGVSELAGSLTMEVFDPVEALKQYQIRDLKPFAGMHVSRASGRSAIAAILGLIGWPTSRMSLENSTVPIGDIAPDVCGEWTESGDVGATAWELLRRLMEDYLGGWHYGFEPSATGYVFVTKSPTTLAAQPSAVTLYWDEAAAILAGIPAADAWRFLYRSHKRDIVKIEANEIVVTGVDARSGLAIQSIKRDLTSQDPTIAPSARPSNWVGQVWRAGVINRGFSSQAVTDGSASLLFDRGSVARTIDSFECEMLFDGDDVPVWRGRKVTLDGIGDVIIQSASIGVQKEPNGLDTWQWRPANYVASNVMGSTGAIHPADIAAIERADRAKMMRQRRNSIGVSLLRKVAVTNL